MTRQSLHTATVKHIRAMVGVYGIYDLPDWWRVTQPPKRTDDPVVKLMGKPYPEAKEDYEDFSPLHRLQKLVGKPAASYLIIHGVDETKADVEVAVDGVVPEPEATRTR